ncbi:uncharacterized protein TNCV_2502351 [Trichonephila clavipes]|nr:uncharacterized protein TNCV_2502351 [Trichonephila clavipes]
MVFWEYLRPTLRCRREAGVSPLLSIGWWYLSSVSPKRHCCRVSAADKWCRVYPLDPRPNAVVLCSGCTPGKRRAWYLPGYRHSASLVGLRGGWRHARTKFYFTLMDPMLLCPGKGLVLPTLNIDTVSALTRFLLISLSNNDMSKISPFAIHKTLIGIGGELKSGPKPPNTIKAGYLNCKIRPYIPNPLRCFKCQRFGHSQTSCRDQLTCSRCASVGHSSTDCTLKPKCVNCTQSHPSYSKLWPKWKLEKQIQEIKTNKNISYFEARKLIVPQLTRTYAQATKPSTVSTTTQTDPNITNIICPPLQCLKPVSSENSMPSTSSSVSTVSTSSSST